MRDYRQILTRPSICTLTAVTALLCLSVAASGRTLRTESPFLPPNFNRSEKILPKKAEAAPTPDRFVLRGISRIGDNYLFSIFDKTTQKAKWIEAGVESNGISITSYDPSTRTIDYSWNQYSGSLQLVNADQEPVQLSFVESNSEKSVPTSSRRNGVSLAQTHARLQESLQRIIFEPRQAERPTSRGYFRSGFAGNTSSSDTFAQTNPTIADNPVVDRPSQPTRYKISRRNSVNNPSGKKPDYMSYADWLALKNSQD